MPIPVGTDLAHYKIVEREGEIEFGQPRPFFDGGKSDVAREGARIVAFDMSRDGQRLVAVVQGSSASGRELVLVQPGSGDSR